MNIYGVLGAIVVTILTLGGSALVIYERGYSAGKAETENADAKAAAAVREASQVVADAAAKAISQIEVKHVTLRQNFQKEIVREPVYRDCHNTPDGLRLINEALTNDGRTGTADPPRLPSANAPQ